MLDNITRHNRKAFGSWELNLFSKSDFIFFGSKLEIWPNGGTRGKVSSASEGGIWEPLVVLQDRSGVHCAGQMD